MKPDLKLQAGIAREVAQKAVQLYHQKQEARDNSNHNADAELISDLAEIEEGI